jgi:hypothetical protein
LLGCCTRTFFQHSHRQVNFLSLNVMQVELDLVVCCYKKVNPLLTLVKN